jgi:thioredoxin-dependent peroxiredoxin
MRTLSLAVAGLVLGSLSLHAAPLPVGSPAPQLTAIDQTGQPLNFADVYAKGTTLVYFYPKAFTGGCTAEACSLRDHYADLAGKGLQIIGVSKDDAATQAKFKDTEKLPFTLVADTDGKVAEAFGVPHVLFESRESFLIKDGKVVWNSPHAQTKGSADEVTQALASLK